MNWKHGAAMVVCLAAIACACVARGGENAEVNALLRDVSQDVQKIPADQQLEVRMPYLEVLARNGRMKDAAAESRECLKLANKVVDQETREGWLLDIAIQQAAAGEFKGAIQTYSRVEVNDRRDHSWYSICEAAGSEQNLAAAMEYAESAVISDRRNRLLWGLLQLKIQRKEYSRATQIAKMIREDDLQSQAYVGRMAAIAGDVKIAVQIAESLPEQGKYVGEMWMYIGQAEADAGQVAPSRIAFDRARKLLTAELQRENTKAVRSLIKLGDIDTALRMLPHVPVNEFQVAQLYVATELARVGKGGLALELSRKIKEPHYRVSALEGIAREEEKRGNRDAALRALQAVTEVPGYVKLGIPTGVIVSQYRLGDRTRAAIRLQEIIEAIDPEAEANGFAAYALVNIAETQIEFGSTSKGGKTFRRALDSAMRSPDAVSRAGHVSEQVIRRWAYHLGAAEITKWAAEQMDPRSRALYRLGIAQGLLDRDAKRAK